MSGRGKKETPTLTQVDARRRSRATRDRMRAWLSERKEAAEKRRAEAAPLTGPRGTDRVPERLRGLRVEPRVLHEHIDRAGRDRRHRPTRTGGSAFRGMPLPSRNTPYVNPDKDRRLAGKARRRARRADR
jgi:hypothetical protein